jgi:hypothetical protein
LQKEIDDICPILNFLYVVLQNYKNIIHTGVGSTFFQWNLQMVGEIPANIFRSWSDHLTLSDDRIFGTLEAILLDDSFS